MDTKALEKFCPWARAELIDAVHLRCADFGLDDKGRAAFPAGSDMVAGNVLGPELKALRDAHYESIEHMGYDAFLEHQAYSWFNRFAAIRYMELHDFLPSHIRMVSSSTGDMYPDCVHAVAELELEGLNRAEAIDLAIAGENEKLYRSIILAQCKELAQALPSVFAGADELTLPNNLLGHGEHDVLHHLVADIPEEAWENVEVLGWMYQFYNSELKDAFFKSKRKAAVEDIPPATQLFTPDWIVRYMVENSLGRLWMLNNPGSRLREQMEYYIEPDGGREDFIRVDGPEDITFCDPACGSGHILVYAFGLLFQMYTERGYRERDIPALILTKNLTGLEIDDRAAQIASLALALCAREHDRRFLTRGVTADIQVLGNIEIDIDALDPASALRERPKLIEALAHLSEIGSLLHPSPEDMGALKAELTRGLSGDLFVSHAQDNIERAAETCETLSRTFDAIAMNPPYLKCGNQPSFLGSWLRENHPVTYKNLCNSFIERGYALAENNGFTAMVTLHGWMFLGSYELLRKQMIENKHIVSLLHLGPGAFEAIGGEVVSTASFVVQNSPSKKPSNFYNLTKCRGSAEKELFFRHIVTNRKFERHSADCSSFKKVPGCPMTAYQASDAVLTAFLQSKSLKEVTHPRVGMQTGKNERFLRMWWEVSNKTVCLNAADEQEFEQSQATWAPYNKGGGFRKWYGNLDQIVIWRNAGAKIRQLLPNEKRSFSILPESHRFRESVTWSDISTSGFNFRYRPTGSLYDIKGMSCFPNHESIGWVLAFTNSSTASAILEILSPGTNNQVGDIGKLPMIIPHQNEADEIACDSARSIALSRADWDTQETSWDFRRSPLI